MGMDIILERWYFTHRQEANIFSTLLVYNTIKITWMDNKQLSKTKHSTVLFHYL